MVDPNKPIEISIDSGWTEVRVAEVLADGRLVVVLPDNSDAWIFYPDYGSGVSLLAGTPSPWLVG